MACCLTLKFRQFLGQFVGYFLLMCRQEDCNYRKHSKQDSATFMSIVTLTNLLIQCCNITNIAMYWFSDGDGSEAHPHGAGEVDPKVRWNQSIVSEYVWSKFRRCWPNSGMRLGHFKIMFHSMRLFRDGAATKRQSIHILMGCAQTAAVGDPREVVGLLFFSVLLRLSGC